jgi:hypothetical protein
LVKGVYAACAPMAPLWMSCITSLAYFGSVKAASPARNATSLPLGNATPLQPQFAANIDLHQNTIGIITRSAYRYTCSGRHMTQTTVSPCSNSSRHGRINLRRAQCAVQREIDRTIILNSLGDFARNASPFLTAGKDFGDAWRRR